MILSDLPLVSSTHYALARERLRRARQRLALARSAAHPIDGTVSETVRSYWLSVAVSELLEANAHRAVARRWRGYELEDRSREGDAADGDRCTSCEACGGSLVLRLECPRCRGFGCTACDSVGWTTQPCVACISSAIELDQRECAQ